MPAYMHPAIVSCVSFFRITSGNGVCPGPIERSPSPASPSRQQHAKLNHAHANGRARLSSRSGSVSHVGSPRPSLTRQPSAATDVGDGSKPNDYLIWAILACLCPVWPINIVGLTFSVMVCVCVCMRACVRACVCSWSGIAGYSFCRVRRDCDFTCVCKIYAPQCTKVTSLPSEVQLKAFLTSQETAFGIIPSGDNGIICSLCIFVLLFIQLLFLLSVSKQSTAGQCGWCATSWPECKNPVHRVIGGGDYHHYYYYRHQLGGWVSFPWGQSMWNWMQA